MSTRKRARVVAGARAVRPIDKEIKVVNKSITASQQATTLKTTTFPCTVVGLRWNISASTILTSSTSLLYWAIIVVRDGLAASTISTSDAADFYTPEQNVLAYGISAFPDADAGAGSVIQNWSGSSKTMRKLKGGDLLQFIVIGTAASQGGCDGVIQFFCKS